MAGIYIHIPFCIKKCGYCDFYSITELSEKSCFIKALIKEIQERYKEVKDENIETIYFGGGTPSVLKYEDLIEVFISLKQHFNLAQVQEITIEVNPDDITAEYLHNLKAVGFNRLSIGIQSFNDRILNFMNRRHNATQAIQAVKFAQKVGFTNISIDLIYGIPNMSKTEWKESIDAAIALNVQHISAYHLTFEPGTLFYKKLKQGILTEIEDKESVDQYNLLISELKSAGFEDYEISNFCKAGFYSVHNSNYWTGNNYIGFGPSAHSLINNKRSWNITSLHEYIKNVNQGSAYCEYEFLSKKDRYNETIMLGLRTSIGLNINSVLNISSEYKNIFLQQMKANIALNNIYEQEGFLKVCKDKKFLTDHIISDFFIV